MRAAMRRARLWWGIILLVAWVFWPAAASAESTGGGEPARAALVSLGEGSIVGEAVSRVEDLLETAGVEVVTHEQLADLLDARRSLGVPAELSAQFAGLTDGIADGVEKFFYKSDQSAVARLQPLFSLGVDHPEVLSRRPDYARQVFEAGVVLVRAYTRLSDEAAARLTARQMVMALPGLNASAATAPPKIIQFLHEEREALAEGASELVVEVVDGAGCAAYVNGTPVRGRAYPVEAGRAYFLRVECGREAAPIWRWEAVEGATSRVLIGREDPLELALGDGGVPRERALQGYLEMIALWSGVPDSIGVAPAAGGGGVVLVGKMGAGEPTWSEAGRVAGVDRMLARVMPGYSLSGGASVPDPEPVVVGSARRWGAWGWTGAGVASVGSATYLLHRASAMQTRVECAANVEPDHTAQRCARWETFGAELEESWVRRQYRRAHRMRLAAWPLAGVGAVALGYGLFQLLRPVEAQRPIVDLRPGPTAVGASIRARF